jgi:hypothetical protein
MKTQFKTVKELPSLEEMQKFVGGYVEALELKNGHTMYVNEEGRLKDLPVNNMATAFWIASWDFNEPIVGNVLYHIKEK